VGKLEAEVAYRRRWVSCARRYTFKLTHYPAAASAANFQTCLVSNCDHASEQYGTDTRTTPRYKGCRCKK